MNDNKTEENIHDPDQTKPKTNTNDTRPSYSQALLNNLDLPIGYYNDDHDDSKTWPDRLMDNIETNLIEFDTND